MKSPLQTGPLFKATVSFRTAAAACALVVASSVAHAQPVSFSTFAGYAGPGSANGAGTVARFYNPTAVALDGSSNIYVADFGNNTIRMVSSSGFVTTLAGSPGVSGSTDASGTNASFNGPQGLALDAAGNIYVADSGNNTIRMVTPSGNVTTLAGFAGHSGSNDATGTNASFFGPAAVAVDSATNVYVADYGNHTIRKITPAGVVSTLAGYAGVPGNADGTGTNAMFNQPQGLAIDASGNLYVGDSANEIIREVTSAGVVTTIAGSAGIFGYTNATGTNAAFYSPQGIAVDASTNLYVADTLNGSIRKITPSGVVTTLAGLGGTFGSADGTGLNARFWQPQGVAVDSANNVYVADAQNSTIRKVTSAGVTTTLAGSPSNGTNDAQGLNARFSLPESIALDSTGNMYVADTANSVIRKITTNGAVSTFAGAVGSPGTADGSGTNAHFRGPQGIAVDSTGNVFVTDSGNHTIRKITSGGAVTTFAGYPGFASTVDATGTNAFFYNPQGIAVDTANNLYVSDTGSHTIRKITTAGVVTTLAGFAANPGSTDGTNVFARFNGPTGVAVDLSGNIYVSDTFNHTIRIITPAGAVTTIAGSSGVWGSTDGTNTVARFFMPQGIAVDATGIVYVSDTGNQTIRRITPSGTNWIVSTMAGLAGNTGSADGTNSAVRFFNPAGLAINSAGRLITADSGNNILRLQQIPLLISNLNVIARLSSAIITWNTTSNATAQVAYGLTPFFGSLSSLNANLTTNEAVLLTGLQTNQTYYFQAISTVGTNQVTATGSFLTDDTIIMTTAQAQFSGVWTIGSSAPDRYTNLYEFSSTVAGSDTAQAVFRPTIVAPGNYDVYVWYSQGSNRSTSAPITVSYQGGSSTLSVNQTANGGSWQLLGSALPFAAGTNGFVRLGNGSGETTKVVIADAVRWVYNTSQDAPTNGTVPSWWSSFFYGTNIVNPATLGNNGYSLYGNYVFGTSPVDPTSRFSMVSQPAPGGGIQVIFAPFEFGRTYVLQNSPTIVHPTWTTIPGLPVTQDLFGNGVITFSAAASLPGYYRVSAIMAP